jgi:mRNA interferase RelE/StbE
LVWTVSINTRTEKELRKLGHEPYRRIMDYLNEIALLDDPRSRGEELQHQLSGLWRYRVGKYRIICELQDNTLTILVVRVGHRGDVYNQ